VRTIDHLRASILVAALEVAAACGPTGGARTDEDDDPSSMGGEPATGGTQGAGGAQAASGGSGGMNPFARRGGGPGTSGGAGGTSDEGGAGDSGPGDGGSGGNDNGMTTGGGAGGSRSGGAGGGGLGTGGSNGSGGAASSGGAGSGELPVTGAGLFSAPAPWYEDVSNAALDSESSQVITGLQAHGGWGTTKRTFQIDFSIDVLHADAGTAARTFTKSEDFFDPDCDNVPIPLPAGGNVEGSKDYACPLADDGTLDGDCHLIVIQGSRLFEMWRAHIVGGVAGGAFTGGCLAVWDLTRNYWNPAVAPAAYGRGDQCSSADAAGYPITDLLFDADEVKAGEIKHAIRYILPNDRIRKGAFVRPATHSGGGKGTPAVDLVPYGARLRLRKSFDLASLPSAGARVVARALQRYGMFLADGGQVALTAKSDKHTATKWAGLLDAGDLAGLKVSDFEMVDGGARIPLTLSCDRTPLTK
jgi:hypothetical protein